MGGSQTFWNRAPLMTDNGSRWLHDPAFFVQSEMGTGLFRAES
jgi:hypothetical protein